MAEKYKIIRLTTTTDYYVPMIDDKKTALNGETITELAESWFGIDKVNKYHATRDQSEIGNSKRVVKYEIID